MCGGIKLAYYNSNINYSNVEFLYASIVIFFTWVIVSPYYHFLFTAQLSHVGVKSPVGLWQTIDDKSGKPHSLIRISQKYGKLSAVIEKACLRPIRQMLFVTSVKMSGKDIKLSG